MTNVSFTWAPAEPGCCPSTCQQILDMVQAAVTGSVDITGIIIGPNTPSVDDRDKVWMVTTDDTNCVFNAIRVWCTTSGTWVDFTFAADTITPGDECTFLGTLNGIVGHRSIAELIDCIGDKQIPCSKIDFGIVPDGCVFNTWQISIQANADSIAVGRIEFEVSWTSATCGVGSKFVTESPIVLGNTYTIDVCMPSDAVQTVTNLKGTAIGGWSNTTVECTPPTCSSGAGVTLVARSEPLTIPTTAGDTGKVSFEHGLGDYPDATGCWFRCTSADGTYSVGDEVPMHQVHENNGDVYYSMKQTPTHVYVICSSQPAINIAIQEWTSGDPNQPFDSTKWKLYIRSTRVTA